MFQCVIRFGVAHTHGHVLSGTNVDGQGKQHELVQVCRLKMVLVVEVMPVMQLFNLKLFLALLCLALISVMLVRVLMDALLCLGVPILTK